MRDKITAILERELAKLDALSQAGPAPLATADIKSLDTLIRAYRSFVDPTKNPPDKPADQDPATMSTDELLAKLNDDQK
jgi:hypothetical protein